MVLVCLGKCRLDSHTGGLGAVAKGHILWSFAPFSNGMV